MFMQPDVLSTTSEAGFFFNDQFQGFIEVSIRMYYVHMCTHTHIRTYTPMQVKMASW